MYIQLNHANDRKFCTFTLNDEATVADLKKAINNHSVNDDEEVTNIFLSRNQAAWRGDYLEIKDNSLDDRNFLELCNEKMGCAPAKCSMYRYWTRPKLLEKTVAEQVKLAIEKCNIREIDLEGIDLTRISSGTIKNQTNYRQETLLMLVAGSGRGDQFFIEQENALQAVELLIQMGGKIKAYSRDGRNALMEAANKGYLKIMQFLISKLQPEARETYVTTQDDVKWTALDYYKLKTGKTLTTEDLLSSSKQLFNDHCGDQKQVNLTSAIHAEEKPMSTQQKAPIGQSSFYQPVSLANQSSSSSSSSSADTMMRSSSSEDMSVVNKQIPTI